jgi:hypothetical protein
VTLGLPPLPPAPGHYRPAGRSVVAVLSGEHAVLNAMCARLAAGTGTDRERRDLADVLTATAVRHLCAEEQYLHPAARRALPDGSELVRAAIAVAAELRRALRRPLADPAGLAGLLRRHRYATARLAEKLAALAPEADLIRLGNRVETAAEAAPTRPHPKAPTASPWNRITDPALGVIDRLQDAFVGRPTREDDLTRRYEYRLF